MNMIGKKKIISKAVAWFMVLLMVVSLLPAGSLVAEAAGVSSVDVGTPSKDANGTYTFPNLTITGDDILSVSVQFSVSVKKTDKITLDLPADASKFERLSASKDTHVVINAKAGQTPTAAEWNQLLRDNLSATVSDEDTVRMMSVIINTQRTTKLIEYNYYNGHYYEVVDGHQSWTDARALSEQGRYSEPQLSSGTVVSSELQGYLVTITSKDENDFVYSICSADTWTGATCAGTTPIGTADSTKTLETEYGYNNQYSGDGFCWFYVTGPEAGLLMCRLDTDKITKTDEVVMYSTADSYTFQNTNAKQSTTVSGAMENNTYNNWANTDKWNEDCIGYDTSYKGTINEPNNNFNEYWMCLYTSSGIDWILPSTWNDFNEDNTVVKQYVIEYGDADNSANNPYISTVALRDSDGVGITANNIIVTKSQAASLTSDVAKTLADATATDGNKTITSDSQTITVNATQLASIKNGTSSSYPLQYTYTNATDGTKTESVTKRVTVVDATDRSSANDGNDNTIGVNNNDAIEVGAYNFEITAAELKELQTAAQSGVNSKFSGDDYAGVVVVDNTITGSPNLSTVKTTNVMPVPDSENQYYVTFDYKGEQTTVVATVTDATTSDPHISAYDFVISKENAENKSKEDLIHYASVEATDENGNSLYPTDITVDGVTFPTTIKDGTTFTFTNITDNNESTNTAKATANVRDEAEDDTGTDGKTVSIGGNNFEITSDELAKLGTASGDAVYKEKAQAVAFANGVSVPGDDIEVVSFVKTSKENVYDVTFAYDGVEVTVQATVQVPYVNAKDFIVTDYEASATSADKIKDYAQATAFEGTIEQPVAVDRSDIAVTNGDTKKIADGEEYTFSYGTGTQAVTDTAVAHVVDKKTNKTVDGSSVTIGANHFVTSVIPEDTNNVSDEIKELFKELADVKATDSSVTDGVIPWDSDTITVTSVVPVDGKANEYNVTYSYRGDEVTVTATYVPPVVVKDTTPESITIVAEPGVSYKITYSDGSEVTTNPDTVTAKDGEDTITFPNLTPNTDYVITPFVTSSADNTEVSGTPADAKTTQTPLKSAQTDTTEPKVGTPITITKITDENGKDVPVDNKNATFQWQVSDDGGKTWKNIDDATSASYTPSASDEGKQIRCEVTGTGAYTGTVFAPSESGATVVKVESPVVIDKNPSSITIEANPDYEYKLLDKQGNVVKDWTTDAGTNDGDKQTGTITFTGLDENTEYQVISRKKGSDVTSDPVSVSTSASKGLELAKETLTTSKPQVGTTVKVKTVTDKNGNTVALTASNVTYQWQYYKDGKWVNISGATGQSYKVPTSMTGYMLRCAVTGVNDYKGTVYAQTEGVSAELNIPTITMKKNLGKKKKFQVKLLNTKGATIRFSSSNPRVATINKKGIVTGKKYGKTTIVINITKGKRQAQYRVVVSVKKSVKKNLSLVKYKTSYKSPSVALYKLMNKKQTYKIKLAHITKKDKVTYSSSNTRIAKVDKNGKVTARRTGRADITIKVVHNGITYEYFMVVRVIKNGNKENNTNYLKVIK